ncbi:retrovirus-related pol polyprotein from transposon TNT 1-94 [Tanacetum coccineum]
MASRRIHRLLNTESRPVKCCSVLEGEKFHNGKREVLIHIIENQWTRDERKVANLDQRLKRLIMSILPDDQMNSVINCLTTKLTWEDPDRCIMMPFNVKEISSHGTEYVYKTSIQRRNTNHVKDYELASLFGKLKYEENLIDNIYETEKNKYLVSATPLSTAFFSSSIVQDFQDSPDDEEDTRSSQEYLNDLKEEYQSRALLAKSKRFFNKAKYNKVKAKLALLSSSASHPLNSYGKRTKVSYVEAYERIKRSVIRMDNEMGGGEVNKSPLKRRKLWELINSLKIPPIQGKRPSFVKSSADDTKVTIPGVERPWNTTDPSVAFIDSSATDYDLADESSVSTPLPPLKKLEGDEPISGPKTIKSILKCERIDHRTCDHAEYMSTMNMSQHLKTIKTLLSTLHTLIIFLEREINPRNPQHAFKRCEACGSSNHTITDHYDIEWFKRGEALQAKKAEALKSTKAKSSNNNRSKTPTKRHMTGVKSYLHKYVKQPGPKVVFEDDSTCTTEGYGSIKCNGIFDEKRGTIFNSNKEIVMIAPRVRDVYVIDMTSSAQESCFFAKASENLNLHWHKRLAHLNFKTINKLAKQNLVIGLPSLVYSKDKPFSSCPLTMKSIPLSLLMSTQGTPGNIILVNFCDENRISQNFSSPYTPEQNSVAKRKNKTLIEATRTMLPGSVFSKQYWTEAVATACYTQNRSTIVKRHLKNPYEIFRKFDEKVDDDYLLRYSLVSKAFKVFNTKRQQIEETYHITFNESPEAIKLSKPSVNNINIAETERYPPDEYLYPYEPS